MGIDNVDCAVGVDDLGRLTICLEDVRKASIMRVLNVVQGGRLCLDGHGVGCCASSPLVKIWKFSAGLCIFFETIEQEFDCLRVIGVEPPKLTDDGDVFTANAAS